MLFLKILKNFKCNVNNSGNSDNKRMNIQRIRMSVTQSTSLLHIFRSFYSD